MSDIFTVFYCWQSDTNQTHARHLIRDALDAAANRINDDSTLPFQVVVHSDTENEPGLCNIPETILRRLREADAIVSDLTFVARTEDETAPKYCSNPNVLFELGYAFRSIGPERLICVMNEVSGESTNQVFDLAHHRRPIAYTSPREDQSRSRTVEVLSVALEEALRGIMRLGQAGHRNDEVAREELSRLVEEAGTLLSNLKIAYTSDRSGVDQAIKSAERTTAEQAIELWCAETPRRLDSLRRGWGALFASIGNPTQLQNDIGRGQCHTSAGMVILHREKLVELLARLDR